MNRFPPQGGVIPPQINQFAHLVTTGDTTDRTSDITALLTAYNFFEIFNSTYYIGTITLGPGYSAFGKGDISMFRLKDSVSSGYCFICQGYNRLRDFRMIGGITSQPSSIGTRDGIYVSGPAAVFVHISNVMAQGLSGAGMHLVNVGADTQGAKLISCAAKVCGVGLYLDTTAEYLSVVAFNTRNCYYGCKNYGGNNTFSACHFDANAVGFEIIGTGHDNHGHGSCSASTFNHNTQYGIYMDGNANGFVFNGCEIHLNTTADVYLKDSSGIVFTGCQFGTGAKITISGGGEIQFNNCVFVTAPTFSITDNTHVQLNNCYLLDGTAVTL